MEWKAAVDALSELQANVACFQETNLHWQPDIELRIQ